MAYVRTDTTDRPMNYRLWCPTCGYVAKTASKANLETVNRAALIAIQDQLRGEYDQHKCATTKPATIPAKVPEVMGLIPQLEGMTSRQRQLIYEFLYKSYGCRIYK